MPRNAGLRDLFVPRYASYWGIKRQFENHIFYRQCMLFVSFLEKNPEQFKKFFIDIENAMGGIPGTVYLFSEERRQ